MIYLTKQDLYDFIPGFTMGFIKVLYRIHLSYETKKSVTVKRCV